MRRILLFAATVLTVVSPALAAGPAGEGLDRWKFMVGEWRVVEKRFDFDAKPIGTADGHATFSMAMNGGRIQELLTISGEPDTTTALHVFAFDPDRGEVEIARTDSGHSGFWIITGTVSDGRMDLKEKHPDPKSAVTRRITYLRRDDDHFARRLEFSRDQGASWFVRNLQEYERE